MSVFRTDHELAKHVDEKTKFVEDPKLARGAKGSNVEKLRLIAHFVGLYEDTNQDMVEFAAEAYVVIRSILHGRRPVKLGYLIEFEGEEK